MVLLHDIHLRDNNDRSHIQVVDNNMVEGGDDIDQLVLRLDHQEVEQDFLWHLVMDNNHVGGNIQDRLMEMNKAIQVHSMHHTQQVLSEVRLRAETRP